MPYEVFVINGEVHSLHGRFRIALAFPAVGMGQFMRISSLPKKIIETMSASLAEKFRVKAKTTGSNEEPAADSVQRPKTVGFAPLSVVKFCS